ncbi:MAG: glycosyltransferase family 87 protein [Acidobacteria bacterium]|nr:glycosyltransferase family 87 protein [Acidobacteriota bacterium]
MASTAKARGGSLGSAIGIAVVLSTFWIILGSGVVPGARQHDFLNLYVGGTLAAEGRFSDLYDQEAQLRLERELAPSTPELIPFVRPHFYALVLSPLSLFSLNAAMWFWMIAQTGVLIACWVWAVRSFGADALIFGALYLPTALGIAHGQDGVFMLAIMIAAYRLASQGRDAPAGAVAALALMKFHLTFLIPVGMIVQKRWRMLGAYCAAAGALVLVSALTGGWAGMVQYVELLRAKDIRRLSPSPELMINIHSVPANFGIDQPVLSAALVALVVVLMGLATWRAPLWRFWSASLIGSILVGPHIFGYDGAILLLAVWLILFSSGTCRARWVATFFATPIVFFCAILASPWPMIPSLTLLTLLATLAWDNQGELRQHRSREVAAARPDQVSRRKTGEPLAATADL